MSAVWPPVVSPSDQVKARAQVMLEMPEVKALREYLTSMGHEPGSVALRTLELTAHMDALLAYLDEREALDERRRHVVTAMLCALGDEPSGMRENMKSAGFAEWAEALRCQLPSQAVESILEEARRAGLL